MCECDSDTAVVRMRLRATGTSTSTGTSTLGTLIEGYLLYGPLSRRVRALRLLQQRQDLPESFLLRLPRHFHRVFQQHHRNAQPAFSDLADKRKLPTTFPPSMQLTPPSGQLLPRSVCCARGRHAPLVCQCTLGGFLFVQFSVFLYFNDCYNCEIGYFLVALDEFNENGARSRFLN